MTKAVNQLFYMQFDCKQLQPLQVDIILIDWIFHLFDAHRKLSENKLENLQGARAPPPPNPPLIVYTYLYMSGVITISFGRNNF